MRFLNFVPIATFVGFIAYALVRNASLLWAAPLLVLGYFFLNPLMTVSLGGLRVALLALVFAGFCFGLMNARTGLVIVSGCILVIWYSHRLRQNTALRALGRAVTEDENLLCSLWTDNLLAVAVPSGDVYWADHKREKGKPVRY